MTTRRHWKPEDDARLREHVTYSQFRKQADWYDYVAQQLGRTAGAVQQRCFVLKLRPQKLAVCSKCKRAFPRGYKHPE